MGRKRSARLAVGALIGTMGCGADLGPPPSTPRIDYIDGAIEPVLVRGAPAVIEGFGFGDSKATGSVRFTASAGTVAAPVPNGGWSDRFVQVIVPDSATSGTVTVATAGGRTLTAAAHVLPRTAFDPASLSWQERAALPRALVGVALAAGARPAGGVLRMTIYAVGGAELDVADSGMVPDSAVFVAHADPGGTLGVWSRPQDLPEPRAFAAVAFANRFNSRLDGSVLYAIGGIDSTGRARATVFRSVVTNDTTLGAFVSVEPLPAPVAGAMTVVHQGRIYVMGGTDSVGSPQANVFVGRVGTDGHIDGWYVQPTLSAPRAYGGGVVIGRRAVVFGGLADSAPVGGGFTAVPPRLVTADTARVSERSGFFTAPWMAAGALLPDGRSQFAELELGDIVLLVGGVYGTVGSNGAETLAAAMSADSLGSFTGPVGTNTIAALGGGTLVGAAAVSWRDADGSHHSIVAGGIDFLTLVPKDGVWGF